MTAPRGDVPARLPGLPELGAQLFFPPPHPGQGALPCWPPCWGVIWLGWNSPQALTGGKTDRQGLCTQVQLSGSTWRPADGEGGSLVAQEKPSPLHRAWCAGLPWAMEQEGCWGCAGGEACMSHPPGSSTSQEQGPRCAGGQPLPHAAYRARGREEMLGGREQTVSLGQGRSGLPVPSLPLPPATWGSLGKSPVPWS